MKILSRYSVLEYLLWVRNNHYLVDDRNKEFCDLLNSGYTALKVFENDSISRNSVFKLKMSTKSYIFKQHGPDLDKRKKYFTSEAFALSTSIELIPKLVYKDKLANVVITEELIDFKPLSDTLIELKATIPNDLKLREFIKKIAEVVKSIHNESTLNTENTPKPKYSEDTWKEFLEDKSQLWVNNLTTQFMGYYNTTTYVHHDLKGKNLLVKDNNIKVLDWEMSEKGDPYYDLCYVIFEICVALIGKEFLFTEINNQQVLNWVQGYINIFLKNYNPNVNKIKLKVFFKVIFYDLYNDDFYFKNIDRCLPNP